MFDQVFRTLKSRNYRLFFGGQGVSLIGTWMQQIAMNWLVYRLTGSTLMLGLVGFSTRIPAFVVAPFGGVIADRVDRYRLLLLTQALSMVQAGVLAALVLTGQVQVWHLVALGLFLGLINSFDVPVRQSFIVEMLDRKEDLGSAIAINSAMNTGARILGPAIAGILVALVGEGWCFSLNALSFIAILGSLLAMRFRHRTVVPHAGKHWAEFKNGVRYAFGFPPIRDILILMAVVSLFGMPFQVLMPVFAKDIFKGGAHTQGFLMSAVGLGAMAGAVFLASRRSVLGLVRRLPWAAAIFGVSLIAFSLAPSFWPAMIVLVATGLGMMVQITSSNTFLQTIVDDDKRGRVMSFYTMAFMGMVPFGNLFSGFLASAIGTRPTVALGGACCMLAAAWFAWRMPEIRKHTRPIYIKKQILPPDPVAA